MKSLETVIRTSARHGNFHGRSQREEDAYFETFAGSDRAPLSRLIGAVLRHRSRIALDLRTTRRAGSRA